MSLQVRAKGVLWIPVPHSGVPSCYLSLVPCAAHRRQGAVPLRDAPASGPQQPPLKQHNPDHNKGTGSQDSLWGSPETTAPPAQQRPARRQREHCALLDDLPGPAASLVCGYYGRPNSVSSPPLTIIVTSYQSGCAVAQSTGVWGPAADLHGRHEPRQRHGRDRIGEKRPPYLFPPRSSLLDPIPVI